MKPKRMLITSALPYANGPLHIGHLVEYVQTDIYVRFLKSKGIKAVYVCADDTHGTPIELNAKKLGVSPEELIAKYYDEHKKDFDDFHINFDSFYSTNSEENRKFADHIFNTLKQKGLIYQKDIELTYCEHCKRFLPDRFVKGTCPKCGKEDQYGDVCEHCNATYKPIDLIDPYCVVCKNSPSRKISNHYFFKLSDFSADLKKWILGNKNLQQEMKNFVINWIDSGLEDWNISRDGPYFGFKIPGEENKYYYVWLDAPIGYIASTENYCKMHGNKESVDDYWKSKDCEIAHFIGKDIVYFHFLFWPAVLMASGFNLPSNIVVHGFLTVKKEKMSKSRGALLSAREYLDLLDPEYLRFYYASALTHKINDVDLDFDDFSDKANNEFVANIANFCYRVLSFINKNFDSKLGKLPKDEELIVELNSKAKEIEKYYEAIEIRDALKQILAYSSIGNKYFQDNAPWKQIKEGEVGKEKAHKVVTLAANIVKNISVIAAPILPNFCARIQKQLGLSDLQWKDIGFDLEQQSINEAEIVVHKIDDIKKILDGNKFPLDLRVAKIDIVQDHPSADKLFVLQIDLGDEKRQLVAGLRDFYKKEQLEGKKVVIVANLKPVKLRGYESQGMLLAAEKMIDGKELVTVLEAKKSKPGDQVIIEGYKPNKEQVLYDDFAKVVFEIKDGHVYTKGKMLKTVKEAIHADIEDGAMVR
ncbi:MAG: methionine--tRNA ligase [Nanoarchaeota archaeon]|nr:methionine--tRNA ligase [Nanoarchaeota archaeon]